MPAWTGIAACLVGFVFGIIALIFWAARPQSPSRLVDPVFWLAAAIILYGFALLWGNVGLLYTHAGFTG
jgi:hypothetical protein